LTYIAVIDVDVEEPVKDSWPDALPIGIELAEAVGPHWPACTPETPDEPVSLTG
jgi:hypothetical protein